MISLEDLKKRLARLGLKQPATWLVKNTTYKENSVRQYLGSADKASPKFLREALKAVEHEEARQKVDHPQAPLWNLLFLTQDEFMRADLASRAVNAESIVAFCRDAILKEADAILRKKRSGAYPQTSIQSAKVADDQDKK